MDKNEILEIFTRQQRINVDYPHIQREVDGPVIRHISLTEERGVVIYSCLDEQDTDAVIQAQIARFRKVPQDFEWKAYDYDPPADLVERLRRHGFEIEEPEALLVLDLSWGPGPLRHPVPKSVVRISDPARVDEIVTLENAVWDMDHHDLGEFLKRELAENPENISIYISYQEGEAASAAWVYFHHGTSFASLWGGSTLPQFRKQGHYSSLLAVRTQEAHRRGFSLLSVDASPMSRPILEKHGFQYLATTTPCIYPFQGRA